MVRRSILFASATVIPILFAALMILLRGEDGKIVTIESVVRERVQFEAIHPLESRPNTVPNLAKRMVELRDRGRSYAATSELDGESIVVHGYWGGSFEGFSIRSEPSDQQGDYLLMKPGSNFQKTKSPFDKIIPRFLFRDPVCIEHNDFVRISGVYHATGYGEPRGFLESTSWIEFDRVERWDQGNRCWQITDAW